MSLYDSFTVDDNGNVVMDPADPVEGDDYGVDPIPSDQVGDLVESPEDVPETDVETQTEVAEIIVDNNNTGSAAVLYSEDVAAIADAVSPAGGSIGSSTIDYFDRIVSGLPSGYKYIAYRTNADNSYDAVLYFSDYYDISDNLITFDECKRIEVVRSSNSSYGTVTNYYVSDQYDVNVSYDLDGSIIYYTNAQIGYPVLGGVYQPMSVSPFLVGAVVCSVLTAVLTKIIRR